jgi:hypothetical protein
LTARCGPAQAFYSQQVGQVLPYIGPVGPHKTTTMAT